MKGAVLGAGLLSQRMDLRLVLHVTDVDRTTVEELGGRLAPLLRAHAEDDFGALPFQDFSDVPGDALAVSDAGHEKGLARDVEEAAHAFSSTMASTKSSITAVFPSPRLITALRKWKSASVLS